MKGLKGGATTGQAVKLNFITLKSQKIMKNNNDSSAKQCKAILLPTEKMSSIELNLKTKELGQFARYFDNHDKLSYIPNHDKSFKEFQHLYVTSNEKIKDLDSIDTKIPLLFISDNGLIKTITYSNRRIKTIGEYYEILGCTNKSLNLPSLSDSFIKKYIEMYNAKTPIVDIMVEYYSELYDGTEATTELNNRVKITNNCIIIFPMKEDNDFYLKKLSYLLEMNNLRKYFNVNNSGYSQIERDIVNLFPIERKLYNEGQVSNLINHYKCDLLVEIGACRKERRPLKQEFTDKWIEENLK